MDSPAGGPPRQRRPWLAPLVAGLVLFAAAASLLVARHQPSPPPAPSAPGGDAPPVGRPAPDFSLSVLGGGTFTLRQVAGKPVLLNFWASWCVPCREEMPMLVRLHKTYGPRGVAFVGIDTEDRADDARRFIAQYHVDYTVVRSDDDRVIDAYAVPGLPTTVFIGADGVVMAKVVGGFVGPKGQQLLTAQLDRMLAAGRR